jgi:predicted secreted protein
MQFLPDALRNMDFLEMTTGQKMDIILKEPAASGYLWEAETSGWLDVALVHEKEDCEPANKSAPDEQMVIGGVGQVTLKLEAGQLGGQAELRLRLVRPFDPREAA